VISQTHQSVKDNTLHFDMNDVAPGVYFIILQSEDETVTKKMVIR